jgi:hypothetical protein
MYSTSSLALFLILMKLFGGFFIGLLVSTFFGPRFRVGLAVKCAIMGGIVFLVVSAISGWAGSHAAFINGRRMDIGPDGEGLWLRNRIAEYGFIIAIVASFVAALATGLLSRRRQIVL